MATNVLQSDSAPPTPLTLFNAVCAVDDVRIDIEQLDSLLYMLAENSQLDKSMGDALRAASRLSEAIAARAGEYSEALMAAHVAARGENVAEFPA